jgi:hypothetical protein
MSTRSDDWPRHRMDSSCDSSRVMSGFGGKSTPSACARALDAKDVLSGSRPRLQFRKGRALIRCFFVIPDGGVCHNDLYQSLAMVCVDRCSALLCLDGLWEGRKGA